MPDRFADKRVFAYSELRNPTIGKGHWNPKDLAVFIEKTKFGEKEN